LGVPIFSGPFNQPDFSVGQFNAGNIAICITAATGIKIKGFQI
jgi:hypothetical protein